MFFTSKAVKLLKYYYSLPHRYNYFIKKPKDSRWYKMDVLEERSVLIEGERIPLGKIKALVVSYESGELIDEYGKFNDLPEGVEELRDSGIKSDKRVGFNRVDLGSSIIEIKNIKNKRHPSKYHYITEITNRSDSPIQVIKFAGYTLVNNRQTFQTDFNSIYSQSQFNDWFDVNEKGWIEPGETVSDPNNYGSGNAYWLYFCKNREGDDFIIGKKMPS